MRLARPKRARLWPPTEARADNHCRICQSDALGFFKWPEKKEEYMPLDEVLEAGPDKRYFVSERIRAKRDMPIMCQL